MQEQDKPPAAPPDPETPASHAHTNGPGMTNGIPDQMGEGEATALPHDERTGGETAASDPDPAP